MPSACFRVATHCSTLPRTAAHCNALQRTATIFVVALRHTPFFPLASAFMLALTHIKSNKHIPALGAPRVCVCMSVCVCTCVCVRVRVRVCTLAGACVRVRACVHTYTQSPACSHTYTQLPARGLPCGKPFAHTDVIVCATTPFPHHFIEFQFSQRQRQTNSFGSPRPQQGLIMQKSPIMCTFHNSNTRQNH